MKDFVKSVPKTAEKERVLNLSIGVNPSRFRLFSFLASSIMRFLSFDSCRAGHKTPGFTDFLNIV